MSEETQNAGDGQTGEGGQGDAAAQGGEQKLTFTPDELQTHFDKTFNARFSEINTKAEAKSKVKIDTLTAEIAALKAGKGDGGKGKGENGEDLSAMTERLAAMEKQVEQSQERDRKAVVLATVAEFNVINSEQVATLVGPSIKRAEDGNFSVLNAEGQKLINAEGQPMTVKEFVGGFLNANSHLVKAGGGTGAGSQGAGPGGPADGGQIKSVEDVNKLSTEDLKKQVAGGLKIPGGAGQVYHFTDPKSSFAKR